MAVDNRLVALLLKRKRIDRRMVVELPRTKDNIAERGRMHGAGAALAFEAEACVFDVWGAGFADERAIENRGTVDLHGVLRGEGSHGETTGRMP